MRRKIPKFRDWDDPKRSNPYGWDYGHGKKRKYVTFKNKREKQNYQKKFENRWFSDRHAVLSFDVDRWRKYQELERQLKEKSESVESACRYFLENVAGSNASIPLMSVCRSERIKDLKRRDSATFNTAQLALDRFIKFAGDQKLNMYSRNDLQGYVDGLVSAGMARKTIRNNLMQVAKIFNDAVLDGHINKSPAQRIALPTTRGEKRLELIDPENLRKLLENAWQNDRTMAGLFAIMFFTGMRTSMIGPPPRKLKNREFIRLDMIDYEHRAIVIPEGIMKKEREHIIEDAPDCMWSWLGELKKDDFGIAQTTFNNRKNKLLAAGNFKWPPNLHRRSFGSYLGALRGRGYAAEIMADKDQSVFVKHYQVPTFKKTAKEYVNIFNKIP